MKKTAKKPAPKKGTTCSSCNGNITRATASNLKGEDGKPLEYASCPGDCNGLTRADVQAVR